MFLSADDLHRLTGRKRFKAQRLALDRLGIRYVAASSAARRFLRCLRVL